MTHGFWCLYYTTGNRKEYGMAYGVVSVAGSSEAGAVLRVAIDFTELHCVHKQSDINREAEWKDGFIICRLSSRQVSVGGIDQALMQTRARGKAELIWLSRDTAWTSVDVVGPEQSSAHTNTRRDAQGYLGWDETSRGWCMH